MLAEYKSRESAIEGWHVQKKSGRTSKEGVSIHALIYWYMKTELKKENEVCM